MTDGSLLFIDVTEKLAKELAKSLYELVCIEGEATWRTDSWAIERFDAKRVTSYQQTDIVEAFAKLAAASGNRWDKVDAIEYVENLRGGGTE